MSDPKGLTPQERQVGSRELPSAADFNRASQQKHFPTAATTSSSDPNGLPSKPDTLQCEIKHYEARYNSEGKRNVRELSAVKDDEDRAHEGQYALRLYKYYDTHGNLERVKLECLSPHIQAALREVVGTYPNQHFANADLWLTGMREWDTLACVFHYREELKKWASDKEERGDHDGEEAKRHIGLLVDDLVLKGEFERSFARFVSGTTQQHQEDKEGGGSSLLSPVVEFSDVWMLLKPGDLITAGSSREGRFVARIKTVNYTAGGMGPPKWYVTAHIMAHDGQRYGHLQRRLEVCGFVGVRAVNSLPFYPLRFHRDPEALRRDLVARGKKYCDLVGEGMRYHAYNGPARAVDRQQTTAMSGRVSTQYPEEAVRVKARVMLDGATFREERDPQQLEIVDARVEGADVPLTDEEYLLCHHVIAGFSLMDKRWAWFFVDFLEDIVWDDGAFDALMLPERQKRLVRALTKRHTSDVDSFDDLIQGKGKGCIFLLHGEPGIGKTFTAESVADDIRRPLYVLMSGELGSKVDDVERNLRQVLKLVTHWKAVLLIDEADIFLEKRSSADLARNSLVSIFLRTLEYFSGVMFLTTNRISSFDLAFQSRIHLALKYQALDAAARERLWQLFLSRTSGFRPEDWSPETLQQLASVPVNGRQIKNSVRTAYALALAEGKDRLYPENVTDVLDAVAEFQADFAREAMEDGGGGGV